MLDGGWRNKLATPIFQQQVRWEMVYLMASAATSLHLLRTCLHV